MPGKSYFVRQATMLLRFAKSTSDPELSARLVVKAADLKSRADPLTADGDVALSAPDVQSGGNAGGA